MSCELNLLFTYANRNIVYTSIIHGKLDLAIIKCHIPLIRSSLWQKSNSHEWLIYNIYNIWVIYRHISLQNIFPSASDEMQPLSCKFCHYSYQCRSANLLGCHDKRSLISSATVPITNANLF